jgi:UDP-N-acetylmuramyl tripeptide synthase
MELPDGADPDAPRALVGSSVDPGVGPTVSPSVNPSFSLNVGSSRLQGANRYYPVPAVLMQAWGPAAHDGATHGRWIALVVDMARVLDWPDPMPRVHAQGLGPGARTWLAFAVPAGRMAAATALNEWAWQAAQDLTSAHPLGADPVPHFRALAAAEDQPALQALVRAAEDHALPVRADDHTVSVGEAAGSLSWPRSALPDPADVPWLRLHTVPKLLVAGSHGKTTVLRLLAAMAAEAGLSPGLACSGDLAEANAVLRDGAVTAALLELPWRSLAQQGLPVQHAQVALVTNVSAEPAGEAAAGLVGELASQQALQALDDRAESMLVVAHAVAQGGALVMNGDDAAVLRVALGLSHSTAPSWALFSRDHATPLLDALRRHGGSTCAPRDGRLVLVRNGEESDLGAIADMPLTLGGSAAQNVANVAAAALAAAVAGWPLDAVRQVLARFGATPQDNPGRLERWACRGATVLIDAANDPDSLSQLLKLAGALGARRVGLLLGQSGGCADAAIVALGAAAAAFRPDRVVIKELPDPADGREPGMVPLLLEQSLRAAGLPARAIRHEHDEEAAAGVLLDWAKPGDVVLLPLHTAGVRERLSARLSALAGT